MTSKPEQETGQQWDAVYNQRFMTMWYPNEDIIRFCALLIQKKLTHDRYEVKRKVERVLDLGCGNGRHAMYFASQGFKAAGVDISEQAITWAKDWANREHLDVDFRVSDIVDLPYEPATFDVVVSHGVLDHVTSEVAQRAVQEVHRVLKPGGLFYCDLRSIEDYEYGAGRPTGHNEFILDGGYERGLTQHFFDKEEVDRLFDGLFGIIYIELHEHKMGPDFKSKFSRWVLATEAI